MLKMSNLDGKFYTLSHVDCMTIDFKQYQEKYEAIRIAQKHNNSLETIPYAIQMYLAMHHSDFALQIPS